MDSEFEIINRIQQRVKQLASERDQLRIKIDECSSQIAKLNEVISQKEEENSQLNEKLKVVKMAKSLDGTSDKNTEVKLKINELVREIDRCVGLLNK